MQVVENQHLSTLRQRFYLKLLANLFCFWNVENLFDYSSIEDIITLVKGGNLYSTSGVLAIQNPETYRKWGVSLKYNPTVIEYEVISFYILFKNEFFNHVVNLKKKTQQLLSSFSSPLSFSSFHPDHANPWASAPQHRRRSCGCETGQLAEGHGWVHARVQPLSLRPLQTQWDPCLLGCLL